MFSLTKKMAVTALAIFITAGFSHCSKKGEVIVEPSLANYTFTTYTVDTFRFKVFINGNLLTDSLLSPASSVSKDVFLTDINGQLKIIDAKTNQTYIDTTIQLKTGRSNITVLQLIAGQKPALPPTPNEPPPGTGKYKLRIQYLQATPTTPFFYDSIKCIIRKGGITIDSVVLARFALSPYYELANSLSNDFTLRVYDPVTGAPIDVSMNSIGGNYSGFNTARIYGTSATNYLIGRIY